MTPAEELRAAAKLMRERAEAATPGPWHPASRVWEQETFAAVLGPEGDGDHPRTWLMATGTNPVSREANASHAASWHPGVALAVADWLARFADPVYCYGPVEYDAALNIARAYRGSGQ